MKVNCREELYLTLVVEIGIVTFTGNESRQNSSCIDHALNVKGTDKHVLSAYLGSVVRERPLAVLLARSAAKSSRVKSSDSCASFAALANVLHTNSSYTVSVIQRPGRAAPGFEVAPGSKW